MKITKRQLRKIIKEEKAKILAEMREMGKDKFIYATDTQSPQRPDEWMQWGKSHGLYPERDRSGQVIFYTEDRNVADDAARAGADVQRDNMGQFVIYTGV